MANTGNFPNNAEMHLIDVVESVARHYDRTFDRVSEDQIAMTIEGSWRAYSITFAWSAYDEILRMVCTFDMCPPSDRLPLLYETLNRANDKCWAGAFAMWAEQHLMIYRYGLMLGGEMSASPEQIDRMLNTAVRTCERFYPAFQLVCWGDTEPETALQIAILDAYGRA
ncbi:MAG: YbjN domain-containing protein [Rhodobacteraceae bacterium]|nr:YbjN domain-containing protein [Paracoccaceae bacterium]